MRERERARRLLVTHVNICYTSAHAQATRSFCFIHVASTAHRLKGSVEDPEEGWLGQLGTERPRRVVLTHTQPTISAMPCHPGVRAPALVGAQDATPTCNAEVGLAKVTSTTAEIGRGSRLESRTKAHLDDGGDCLAHEHLPRLRRRDHHHALAAHVLQPLIVLQPAVGDGRLGTEAGDLGLVGAGGCD